MRPLAFTLALFLTHLVLESSAFVIGPGRQTRMTRRFSLTPESNNDETVQPDILLPFLPAADPKYAVRGPVGDKDFVLDRSGGPTEAELTNENILKIVKIECSDLEVGHILSRQPCRCQLCFYEETGDSLLIVFALTGEHPSMEVFRV